MTPKEFQQELCKRISARLDAQGYAAKGKKRDRAAIELLCGACFALEVVGSDQLSAMLMFTTIACSRSASEMVDRVAITGAI